MFLYKFSDKELKELLKSLVILCDTREQESKHIIQWFKENKINYEIEKLDTGDYSCYLPASPEKGIPRNIYFNDLVSIERKANLGELSANLTEDRTRLENEFRRAKGKLYLMIENADYGHIISGTYNSNFKPKSFVASIKTFEARYGVQTVYLNDRTYSGSFIYNTMLYHIREHLK